MRTLVAYYSRTGNTRKVAGEIAKELKADLDEIVDKKSRKGPIGWLRAGRDAMRGSHTPFEIRKDPKNYNVVIVGTPVWAFTVVPAVRAYLAKNRPKKVAFFCTCGGNPGKAFVEMEKLAGKPVATLVMDEKKLDDRANVTAFCRKVMI
ncbi:MAG: flavodoxin [Candidatus Aenigmatarchaeota archaeon]